MDVLSMYRIKGLLILILSILTLTVQAQKIDSSFVPNEDTLEASLRDFYKLKTDAEQTELKQRIRFKWLRFLPSVGWNFGLNSPFIGWNTSDLVGAINHKQTKKTLLTAIEKQNEILFNEDLIEVQYQLDNLVHKMTFYQSKMNVFELEKELFEITQKGYDEGEITPTIYLSKKIQFENLRIQIEQLKLELIELRNSIFIKAKKAQRVSLF